MVSGTPRTGSAIARTNVECYLLDREGFAEVLRTKPELTRVLAERISALAALRSSVATKAIADLPTIAASPASFDLLSKVSRYFGLGLH